jgi:hypothetical protein
LDLARHSDTAFVAIKICCISYILPRMEKRDNMAKDHVAGRAHNVKNLSWTKVAG